MDYGWLNIGSFLFGLIALILPVINITKQNKSTNKTWVILSMISIGSCAISLCMQIIYTNYLVNINDWSALLDILDTVTSISIKLLVVTIILNIVTFVVYYGKNYKN